MAYKSLNSIVSIDDTKSPIQFKIDDNWTFSIPVGTSYFTDEEIENNIFAGTLDLSGSIKPLIIRGSRKPGGNYSFELALERHADFEGRFKTVDDIKYDKRDIGGDEGCLQHVMIIDEPNFAVDAVVCRVPFFGTVITVRIRSDKHTAFNLSSGFEKGTSEHEINTAKNMIIDIAKSIRNVKLVTPKKSATKKADPGTIFNNGDFIIKNAVISKYIGSGSQAEVPHGITEIADNAFHSASLLTRIVLPSTLKKIGANAFSGCVSMQDIELPDSVEDVKSRAFENCFEIRTVRLSNKMKSINEYLFVDCHALSHIEIPDGIKTVSDSAFSDCISLQNPYIPQSVTHIEQYAFKNCSKITHLVLPEKLTSIGAYAFAFCPSLTYLFIPASVIEITSSYFGDDTPFHESNNITIYCPMNSYMQNYATSHGINYVNATTPDQNFLNETAAFKKPQTKKSADSKVRKENNDAINTKDVLDNNHIEHLENGCKQSRKSQQTDQFRSAIAGGGLFSIGLRSNGSVIACGENTVGQCDVESWHDIVSVTAGGMHTIGLKTNGTVVATGCNDDRQCNVQKWTDITSVSAGLGHTVGVKSDGTVVAVGQRSDKQCNVVSWRNIIGISSGDYCTIGLKSDGTVVAAGSNEFEECNVKNWRNIVAISAGSTHVAGLKADGTVEVAGFLDDNDLAKKWSNIIAISSGNSFLAGLRADRTIVAIGHSSGIPSKIHTWRDIVEISAGSFHILGLRSNGTVISCGEEKNDFTDYCEYGQCIVDNWTNIGLQK